MHVHPLATLLPELPAGHATRWQPPLKNGGLRAGVTRPEKPLLHEHPAGMFAPVELLGHATGTHVLTKNGDVIRAVTFPLYPALHVHPENTLTPEELAGQARWLHVLVKKGVVLVAVTVPLRPGTHTHPEGTLMPVDRGGHRTAEHEKDVGKIPLTPEHAVDVDAVTENPGMHTGATAPLPAPSGHDDPLLATSVVAPNDGPTAPTHEPLAARNKPRVLHVAMRVSCCERAALDATL